MTYLWLKWIHIVSSTLLFGTGLGIAFFMWRAHLGGDPRVIAATARTVVVADACFTAPAVLVQIITGFAMVHLLKMPLTSGWLLWSLVLFVLIGMCWLPVLWLQWRAQKLAQQAVADGTPLNAQYHRVMRWWFWLGWPAFISVLAIFWMMVTKQAF